MPFVLGAVYNLISQVIMERLTQSHVHEDGSVSFSPTLTIAKETSQMAIDDTSLDSCRSSECSSSSLQLTDLDKTDCVFDRETAITYQTKQLKYLVYSYDRSLNEEKNHPKVKVLKITYLQKLQH